MPRRMGARKPGCCMMDLVVAVVFWLLRRAGGSAAHVYTFADHFQDTLCFLASTVQAAGGVLHVLGLRDGGPEFRLPWGDLEPARGDEPWHFGDRSVMLKKHVFLRRAIRGLGANETVIFVDAFDVLFQRPLAEMVATYQRLARPSLEKHGFWPVVFGGERNCWPFPHKQTLQVPNHGKGADDATHRTHRIPDYSMLSTEHNANRRYPYGHKSPWSIRGDAVCAEVLAQHDARGQQEQSSKPGIQSQTARGRQPGHDFPFLCAGTFMGTVSAIKRLYGHAFGLYTQTREYHDQALLALALLRNESLGFVDTSGHLFLALHGHEELDDLDRRLCHAGYFTHRAGAVSTLRLQVGPNTLKSVEAPVVRDLGGHIPSPLRGDNPSNAPGLLHFNGNAKQHYPRCVEMFSDEGFISSKKIKGQQVLQCIYFDGDLRDWAVGR